MRLFLVLILLSTSTTFAADCTEADSPFPVVCDNLFINNNLDISAEAGPIVINVTGVVEIRANITFNGANGINGVGNNLAGGSGGPSAGAGGGVDNFGLPQAAEDPFPGLNNANGKAASTDVACGNGGGGGALLSAGANGSLCATSGTAVGAGGIVSPTEFDFGLNFRGGYGGGCGGNSASTEVGTGGGGGGALHIIAGGNVTIFSSSTISGRGGNGGNALNDGGGGGAGSGGALWIQSTAGIISNLGTIDLRGGTGGRNNVTNAHGGNGGDGGFQFEDLNGTINGTGLTLPASTNVSTSANKYSSSISCGAVSSQNDKQNIFQAMMGFFLVLMMGLLIRTLSRFPKKLL